MKTVPFREPDVTATLAVVVTGNIKTQNIRKTRLFGFMAII